MAGKLSGNHLRFIPAVSRGQNELIVEFNMTVGDVISIRG
jgi:hypothetical protein